MICRIVFMLTLVIGVSSLCPGSAISEEVPPEDFEKEMQKLQELREKSSALLYRIEIEPEESKPSNGELICDSLFEDLQEALERLRMFTDSVKKIDETMSDEELPSCESLEVDLEVIENDIQILIDEIELGYQHDADQQSSTEAEFIDPIFCELPPDWVDTVVEINAWLAAADEAVGEYCLYIWADHGAQLDSHDSRTEVIS